MQTKKNLLIVCEGTNTEPEYFHQLRDDLIARGVDYHITIKPKPPTEAKKEMVEADNMAEPTRPGAKRRQVTNVPVPNEEFTVEEEYQAQPTRYVREAQLGIIDGTYDEAWAIYDQDGHARHAEALALANNDVNNLVHVGFSSVAFEHWLLLHFEYSDTAFLKSQCRQGKEYFDCGQNIHAQDCGGARCLAGYMKHKGYIPSKKNIKEVGYSDLSARTSTALTNALSLRHSQIAANLVRAIYEINPITTVDRLVLKLLKQPLNLIWTYTQPIKNDHRAFEFEIVQNILSVTIHNSAKAGYIFQHGHFIILDQLGEHLVIFERFIIAGESTIVKTFDLTAWPGHIPVYAGILLVENQYKIVEI